MAIQGLEILMSKLHHFSALLKTVGIESDLIGGLDSDLPILMIYFEQGDVQLTCIPGDNDGRAAHFLLELRTDIPVQEEDFLRKQTVCDLFCEESLAGLAYHSTQENAIVYRQILPEAILPVSDETFLYFVQTYADYLGLLNAFIAQILG